MMKLRERMNDWLILALTDLIATQGAACSNMLNANHPFQPKTSAQDEAALGIQN